MSRCEILMEWQTQIHDIYIKIEHENILFIIFIVQHMVEQKYKIDTKESEKCFVSHSRREFCPFLPFGFLRNNTVTIWMSVCFIKKDISEQPNLSPL